MTTKQRPAKAERGKHGATCHRSDGAICDGRPVKGSTVCHRHLVNKKARANATVRAAFAQWTPDDNVIDPVEGMLRHATIADRMTSAVAQLIEEGLPDNAGDLPALVRAFVGTSYGESGKPSGEYIRGLVTLHGILTDRTMRFLKMCDDARLEERRLQISDEQGQALFKALEGITRQFDELVFAATGVRLLDPRNPQVREIVQLQLAPLHAGAGQ